jgi:filamentous hemagglutinin family protein
MHSNKTCFVESLNRYNGKSGERTRLACRGGRPRRHELFRRGCLAKQAVAAATDSIKGRFFVLLLFVTSAAVVRLATVALLTLSTRALFGGIVLDGSFGTSGALPGPNYMIQAGFGKQVGTNLFQSFNQFNLINTESATFTGPANIQNIVSRVTGGTPSSIDGTISSQIQGANLFFLNPSGVIFGPHAQLDVSGSVAISTANYLKMSDGGRFNASLGGNDTLTSAPISAFGFLNSNAAPVSFMGTNTLDQNLVIVPGPGLFLAPEKSFLVVAGDIQMSGAYIRGPGTNVNLVSVGSAGEVKFNAGNLNGAPDVSQFSVLGRIELTNNAFIDTSGQASGPLPSGPVTINCGKLVMNSGQIEAFNFASAPGGNVSLDARDSIEITNGGFINATTGASGKAGDVLVQTASLTIDGSQAPFFDFEGEPIFEGTGIAADSGSFGETGASGVITVKVSGPITILGGGGISTGTGSSAKGGTILIEGDSLFIDGEGLNTSTGIDAVSTLAIFGGSGDAGSITVKITNGVTIKGGGDISTDTGTIGTGGNVLVEAGSLRINGDELPDTFTGISADSVFGGGNSGDVTVRINGPATLRGGGEISTSSFFSGNAGSVLVKADSLFIGGYLSDVSALTFGGHSDAGNIMIRTADLRVVNQGSIDAEATGNGGNIEITSPGVVYLLNSSITAAADANGGNITIDPQFIVLNNSLISANAAAGQGGNINLISNFFFESNSLITATGTTNNGTVNITAPTLDLGAELITLPTSLISAEDQLRERCTSLLQGDFSSFISLGRGGTEPEPDELQTEF